MTDDLVKRLRDRGVCSPAQNSCRNDLACEQAADRLEELQFENFSLRPRGLMERERIDSLERHLGGLLAIIHRDGGHHTENVGYRQSVDDAHKIWAGLVEARRGALEEAAVVAEGVEEFWAADKYWEVEGDCDRVVRPSPSAAIRALKDPK
jgi:hypothetical protein